MARRRPPSRGAACAADGGLRRPRRRPIALIVGVGLRAVVGRAVVGAPLGLGRPSSAGRLGPARGHGCCGDGGDDRQRPRPRRRRPSRPRDRGVASGLVRLGDRAGALRAEQVVVGRCRACRERRGLRLLPRRPRGSAAPDSAGRAPALPPRLAASARVGWDRPGRAATARHRRGGWNSTCGAWNSTAGTAGTGRACGLASVEHRRCGSSCRAVMASGLVVIVCLVAVQLAVEHTGNLQSGLRARPHARRRRAARKLVVFVRLGTAAAVRETVTRDRAASTRARPGMVEYFSSG